jgi:ketosteroid isomerase-like protein
MSMRALSLSLLVSLGACAPASEPPSREVVDRVLDDWHLAAAQADEERYFGHFAPEAVFMGTDATERWTREEFRTYAHERFKTGTGWTYTGRDRHVAFSPAGDVAWVDERLDNARYGELRGTAVLLCAGDTWKIAHYNMVFPIPNDLAPEVVARIKETLGPK